jgi:hypothetical protein
VDHGQGKGSKTRVTNHGAYFANIDAIRFPTSSIPEFKQHGNRSIKTYAL